MAKTIAGTSQITDKTTDELVPPSEIIRSINPYLQAMERHLAFQVKVALYNWYAVQFRSISDFEKAKRTTITLIRHIEAVKNVSGIDLMAKGKLILAHISTMLGIDIEQAMEAVENEMQAECNAAAGNLSKRLLLHAKLMELKPELRDTSGNINPIFPAKL